MLPSLLPPRRRASTEEDLVGITALVVLASSLSVAAPAPLRLVVPRAAFANPMLHVPQGARDVSGLTPLRTSPAASATEPSTICHMMTLKPDPAIDPKMAVEAPKAFDPKIVRRAPCASPARD